MKHFDTVVIGAGPGGYEAAIELGRAGLKTLLIDKSKERIGGTCLNEGCISTKNYLESASYVSKASYFTDCGLDVEVRGLNMERLREKTIALKNELRSGVVWLLDQAGVETFFGEATFIDFHTIDVSGEKIGFEKCIIATGAKVREIPLLPLDGKRILSSREVFDLTTLPKSIAIIGGGAVGCEFATFFSAFGVNVTLIARGAQLLTGEDEDISKALIRSFKKSGITVMTSTSILKVHVHTEGVTLSVQGQIEEDIECELVLSAIGRDPNTQDLHLENAGVQSSSKGYIIVNASFQTIQQNIYALGDCIDTPAYAHTAYAEAKIAARNLINGTSECNHHINPSTVFSNPQIACCGLSEKDAKEQGRSIHIKKAFLKVNAKAKINGDDSGFVKMIVCSHSDTILGATIIGGEATEIIHEMVMAVEQKLTSKDLANMIHVHPSVSEIFRYL
ncbi:MAG: dihydrolipoyl dehydrogenase [Campylobacterales bacterium]|nr:dihydrolipoyl dehydrogenase [Campylobacterales bacterium]